MKIAYFDGRYIQENEAVISIKDRSFRYGDGVFESIAVFQKNAPLLKAHLERLNEALEVLSIRKMVGLGEIEEIINELRRRNDIHRSAVVNVLTGRKEGGFYKPASNEAHLVVRMDTLDRDGYELNNDGKKMGVYLENVKSYGSISRFKTGSALLYVLAGKFCSDNGFDDCILLNAEGNIAEAFSSNIFISVSGSLYTPSIESACVAGTMRQEVIQLALERGIECNEVTIKLEDLLKADELFTTNAVKGIQWVKKLEESEYDNSLAVWFVNELNKKWGLI